MNDLQSVHHCGYELEYDDPRGRDEEEWRDRKLQTFSFHCSRYNIDKIVVINHQTEKTFAYFVHTTWTWEHGKLEDGKYIESENSAWLVFNRFRWDILEFVYFLLPSHKTIFIIVLDRSHSYRVCCGCHSSSVSDF